jgi:quinol monooxygenase YgiN
MILIIIRMEVISAKRMELSQTITSLISSIKKEKGCKSCDFCQSMEDENQLFLLEEWETRENLRGHLKSGHFKVLRGAMTLLKEPCEMMFHTVFHPEGMDETGLCDIPPKGEEVNKGPDKLFRRGGSLEIF